jgi:hypothetical protein
LLLTLLILLSYGLVKSNYCATFAPIIQTNLKKTMKKVFSTMLVAGFIALVSCGPSAEDKAAAEKAAQDSIAAVEAANANTQQSAMQDSAAMAAPATTDSAAMAAPATK